MVGWLVGWLAALLSLSPLGRVAELETWNRRERTPAVQG